MDFKYSQDSKRLANNLVNQIKSNDLGENVFNILLEIENTIIINNNIKKPAHINLQFFDYNYTDFDKQTVIPDRIKLADEINNITNLKDDDPWKLILQEYLKIKLSKQREAAINTAITKNQYVSKDQFTLFIEAESTCNTIVATKKDYQYYQQQKYIKQKLNNFISNCLDSLVNIFLSNLKLFKENLLSSKEKINSVKNKSVFNIEDLILIQFNDYYVDPDIPNTLILDQMKLNTNENYSSYIKLYIIHQMKLENPSKTLSELNNLFSKNGYQNLINLKYLIEDFIPHKSSNSLSVENLEEDKKFITQTECLQISYKNIFIPYCFHKHSDLNDQYIMWNNEKYYIYCRINKQLLNVLHCSTIFDYVKDKIKISNNNRYDITAPLKGCTIDGNIVEDENLIKIEISVLDIVKDYEKASTNNNKKSFSKGEDFIIIENFNSYWLKQPCLFQNIPNGIAEKSFKVLNEEILKTRFKMSYEYDFLNYDHPIFDIIFQGLLQNAFPEKYINSNWVFVDKVINFQINHMCYQLLNINEGKYERFNDNNRRFNDETYNVESSCPIKFRGYGIHQKDLKNDDSKNIIFNRIEFLVKYEDYEEVEWIGANHVSTDILTSYIELNTRNFEDGREKSELLNDLFNQLSQYGNQQEEEDNENEKCNTTGFPFIRSNFNLIQRPKIYMIDCIVTGMLEKISHCENSKRIFLNYASLIYAANNKNIESESFENIKNQLITDIDNDNLEQHVIYIFLILFATYFNMMIFLCKKDTNDIEVVYPLYSIAIEIKIGYKLSEMEGLTFELSDTNKVTLSYLQPKSNIEISKNNIQKNFIDLVSREIIIINNYCEDPYIYERINPTKSKLSLREYQKCLYEENKKV
jgi:hypothetical protein